MYSLGYIVCHSLIRAIRSPPLVLRARSAPDRSGSTTCNCILCIVNADLISFFRIILLYIIIYYAALYPTAVYKMHIIFYYAAHDGINYNILRDLW